MLWKKHLDYNVYAWTKDENPLFVVDFAHEKTVEQNVVFVHRFVHEQNHEQNVCFFPRFVHEQIQETWDMGSVSKQTVYVQWYICYRVSTHNGGSCMTNELTWSDGMEIWWNEKLVWRFATVWNLKKIGYNVEASTKR